MIGALQFLVINLSWECEYVEMCGEKGAWYQICQGEILFWYKFKYVHEDSKEA